MTWAWDSDAEETDLLVLLCLADWASVHDDDEAERCWPSIAKVAGRCKVSTRTVQRSVKQLAAMGAITIAPHEHWQGRADRRPNAYTISDPRGDILTPRDERGDTGGTNGVTPGVTSADDTLSVEPKENPTGAAAPDWTKELPAPVAKILGTTFPEPFEKTWMLYPSQRRKAKRGTYKAWRATVARIVATKPGPNPHGAMMMLYTATANYAAAMADKVANGSSWDYVKLSETFYGPAEPWRDYLTKTNTTTRKEWQA